MGEITEINNKINTIRHHKDEKSGEFYFSIVDIIDVLGLSTDSRNYWKVLKNRLNKRNNKLVTECNQLKMKSSDGKYYLTDVATAHTILQIIQIIIPEKVAVLGEFFDNIEDKNSRESGSENLENKKISTYDYDEGEIPIDMYLKGGLIEIKTMLAGVNPDNIFLSINCKTLTLKINRQKEISTSDKNYDYKELNWGKFSRIVSLPFEVDIDRVDTDFIFGLLSIKLFILDKTRTKIIKIKNI